MVMLAKLAMSVLFGGASLALGAAPAMAAAPGSAAADGTAAHCGPRVEAALDRLGKWESHVSKVLARLEAAEQKAQSAGHTKLAEHIADRITRVEQRQSRIEGRVSRIEQRCPGVQANGSTANGSTANG
jgi:hypothetical protein